MEKILISKETLRDVIMQAMDDNLHLLDIGSDFTSIAGRADVCDAVLETLETSTVKTGK